MLCKSVLKITFAIVKQSRSTKLHTIFSTFWHICQMSQRGQITFKITGNWEQRLGSFFERLDKNIPELSDGRCCICCWCDCSDEWTNFKISRQKHMKCRTYFHVKVTISFQSNDCSSYPHANTEMLACGYPLITSTKGTHSCYQHCMVSFQGNLKISKQRRVLCTWILLPSLRMWLTPSTVQLKLSGLVHCQQSQTEMKFLTEQERSKKWGETK